MNQTWRLREAYLQTTYWVEAMPQPLALRIGQTSRGLDRVLASRVVCSWVFITAWNPHSQLRPHWYNVSRQRALPRELKRSGFPWLAALAQGDAPGWPPEPGVLVLGMTRPQAYRLGRRFRQNAVVTGKHGQPARLLWCRH